jgi:hypothetical protein
MGLATVVVITNPLQRGLIGYYYDNPGWKGTPILTVRERSIDLYRKGVEFPSIKTNYSIEWKGVIFTPISGEYQFRTIADDHAEIFINNQPVHLERGHDGNTGTVHLKKGFYPLTIRYNQKEGAAEFNVSWRQPGQERETLPYAFLFLKQPTPFQFFVGRSLEVLLMSCKLLGLLAVTSGFLLLLCNRRRIFVAFANHALIVMVIFLIVFVSHFFSRNSTSSDSMWSIATTLSIIREKNTDLDEYIRLIEEFEYYAVARVGNHLYPVFPVGTSILSIPFVYALDRFLDRGLGMDLGKILSDDYRTRGGIEIYIASILMALSSIFIYCIGCLLLNNLNYSLLITFIFAFCTSAWSTASRALWQHTSSIFFLTILLYLLLLAKKKPEYEPLVIRLSGIFLAFSFVVRPTNSISILLFTIYIFIQHRKHFLAYCLWSLIVAIPFFLSHFQIYHSPLSPYYLPHRIGSNPHFWEALAGNLFSPSRGLFIFSPVLLFSLYGIVLKIQNKQIMAFDYFIVTAIVLHWIVISTFPRWWAGHSYGPRFFSDVIPYLMYFLIPAISKIATLRGFRKISVTFLFFCVMTISFLIHFRGAMDWEVYAWNSDPVNVDENPSRIWDWRDMQFLR